MSIETFTVRPLTEAEKCKREADNKNVTRRRRVRKSCGKCWLCGFGTCDSGRWANHLDKHRREDWRPRPVSIPKRPAALVFAEWQQQDV